MWLWARTERLHVPSSEAHWYAKGDMLVIKGKVFRVVKINYDKGIVYLKPVKNVVLNDCFA